MRVVLDTNVLISAFLWQQQLKPIYHAVRLNSVVPSFSSTTLQELKRTLIYPKLGKQLLAHNITADEIVEMITSRAYFVSRVSPANVIQDDPADNNILACAVASNAEYIVLGDKYLLKIKEFVGIPVVSPAVFMVEI